MRNMSKSAVRVAREALAAGRAALPTYGSPYSRRDYTQPQLFALLVLKQFLRADYRGLVALVAEWRELRHALGLRKVPHYSTLAHAARRLLAGAEMGGTFRRAQAAVVARARAAGLIDAAPVAAVDATGLEARHVSAYFRMRRGEPKRPGRRKRAWPKLTAVLHAHSHLILGAVTGTGPTQDSPAFAPAMRQAAALLALDTVLADAAYDAEHNHRLCREALGVRRSASSRSTRATRGDAGRRRRTDARSAAASRGPFTISAGTSRAASASTNAASAPPSPPAARPRSGANSCSGSSPIT
jgi:hypothetical protein